MVALSADDAALRPVCYAHTDASPLTPLVDNCLLSREATNAKL